MVVGQCPNGGDSSCDRMVFQRIVVDLANDDRPTVHGNDDGSLEVWEIGFLQQIFGVAGDLEWLLKFWWNDFGESAPADSEILRSDIVIY